MSRNEQDLALIAQFLERIMLESGLSPHTISAYRTDLEQFSRWLAIRKSTLAQSGSEEILAYLSARTEQGIQPRTRARFLFTMKRYYQFAMQQKWIEANPAKDISMPKTKHYLSNVISEEDVVKLLSAANTKTNFGLRDRAMLEVLYATGLRVGELVNLTLPQVNLQTGIVRVAGKANKQRLAPMGQEAMFWIEKYLTQARPEMLKKKNTDAVFLSSRGTAMTRQAFWQLIKKYAAQAQMKSSFSPHTLRHAFACHLLNHGVDLRAAQMLLGHASLSTTQIYAHVANEQLKLSSTRHHPGESS